jgi:hypothetical protein
VQRASRVKGTATAVATAVCARCSSLPRLQLPPRPHLLAAEETALEVDVRLNGGVNLFKHDKNSHSLGRVKPGCHHLKDLHVRDLGTGGEERDESRAVQ